MVRSPGANILAIFRGYDRELVCSQCRSVIAWIRLRPFSLIAIRDTLGQDVTPFGGTVALGAAEVELSDAKAVGDSAGDGDVRAARRRIDYFRREAGEVFYEFTCPNCGTRYDRSLPHLTKDVRHAPAGRVALK